MILRMSSCSCAPCARTPRTPRCRATGCWCAPATSAAPRPASTPGCRSGLRVLRNVEQIVREEMDAIGAQELQFPALLPREPYEATGRWTEYGDGIFRLKDRKGGDYLLGPTHEEMFTLVVKDLYSSYKDLPVWLYQIQTKYRDEARPRAGLLRGREFVMKDSYSFDITDEGLERVVRRAPRGLRQDLRPARLRLRHRQGDLAARWAARSREEFLATRRERRGHLRPLHAAATTPPTSRPCRCGRPRPSPYDDAPGRARRADAGHPHHRDAGRPPQREVPARRPALERRRHAEERAGRAQAPRRHPRAAGDRPARRPRGRPEAARGPARADRGRGVRRGRLRQAPDAGQGLHRPRRAGREERRPASATWSTRASSRAPAGSPAPTSHGSHVLDLVAGRDFTADGTIEAAEVRDGDPCPRL